ncbi:hypothetical protein BHM03_00058196 [Ensete ventricosum]|nr:hypothetical protein BHM03_00058196 [Ensete ventricosum]
MVKTIGPSVDLGVLVIEEEDGSWINEILRFKQTGALPEDKATARRIRRMESWYSDAHLRTLAYRRAVTKLYNRRVHPRYVKMGDLVLRKVEVSDPTRSRGKLASN